MKVIETVAELQAQIQHEKESGKSVGFVPTMGALHNGHASLVKRCRAENDFCGVSVFVNPTQFNNPDDLKCYPRTFEADRQLLEGLGVDFVFAPTVEEMYPEEDTREFDFGAVMNVMEGAKRPGHFNGVAQVVSKLFYMVTPDRAYFGEKDFQQVAVIRAMVKELAIPVEIVACPIVRESDGLALSSRNTLLTPEHRQIAPMIAQTLMKSVELSQEKTVAEVKQFVIDTINAEPLLEVEYYEIVDALTMQAVSSWNDAESISGCVTVYAGAVRLIDNIKYK